jgi:hypothetical protein
MVDWRVLSLGIEHLVKWYANNIGSKSATIVEPKDTRKLAGS